MANRSWAVGDPEPIDHPALVDTENVSWLWDPDNFEYIRQKFTHYPHPDGISSGVVLGSPMLDWEEILDEFGPVREATAEEARTLVQEWAAKPLGSDTSD